MTITLEIGPELQAKLVRQAAAQGMGIDQYAASLLEEAAHNPTAQRKPTATPPVSRSPFILIPFCQGWPWRHSPP